MDNQQKKAKPLHIVLWIVQVLLACLFIGTGVFKVVTPVGTLARMWPWAGEYPTMVRFSSLVDLLGGIGIVLPTLTRIKPELTGWAALGCAALMGSAIVFHFWRGEGANTPFNFVLLALALFVFWGRRAKPITTTKN